MNQFNSTLVGVGTGRVANVVTRQRVAAAKRTVQSRAVSVPRAAEATAKAERTSELLALGATIATTIGLGAFLVLALADSLLTPVIY